MTWPFIFLCCGDRLGLRPRGDETCDHGHSRWLDARPNPIIRQNQKKSIGTALKHYPPGACAEDHTVLQRSKKARGDDEDADA